MQHDFSIGLPSKTKFDNISQSGVTRLVIQKHDANKAGLHYDMRLHDGDISHSFVTKSLPWEKSKLLAIRQPSHRAEYSDFEGTIKSGYGKGEVSKIYDSDANIVKANNKYIKFETDKGNFLMIKPKKFSKDNWLMIKTSSVIENPITSKPKYKTINYINYEDVNTVLQPKLDGSHSILELLHNLPNRIYSYRNSKKTGEPIEHSDQVPWIRDLKVPKSLHNTTLRGELYITKNDKPVNAEIVGGVLNSNTEKSLATQDIVGKLKPYIFDIVRYNKQIVEKEPYSKKYELLKKIESKIPELRVAETAFTPAEKQKLVDLIKSNKHPDTREGIIQWNLHNAGVDPSKLKYRDTHDIYIREIFPAVKQSTGFPKEEAGGFRYSLTKNGPIVGNVGTGFSKQNRIDFLMHPENYVGKVARVKALQQFSSGALRAPSYVDLHVERNLK